MEVIKKHILLEAIDTSMFLLPELPGRVDWLNIPGVRGRGVYTSLVARRMADAYRDGARAAVIQAVRSTSAPICQKHGFVEFFNLDWYIWEPEDQIP